MVYSSFEFIVLLFFLIPLFYSTRNVFAQLAIIFLASCLFLSFTGTENLIVAVLVISVGYLALRLGVGGRSRAIVAAIAILVLNLMFFKLMAASPALWRFELPWGGQSHWLVPLGLSFYTFQIIGGLIELNHVGRPVPIGRFANFVLFFPHLIAGPICKSRVLVPQFEDAKRFSWRNLGIGLHLFLVGYVKKVLIADPIGAAIDDVWSNPAAYATGAVWLATAGFYLQVYADFSGYTDMGRGVARMLGFRLPINFRAPYLAASPLDFWQRWHISLTTWYRHYFYQPLALWIGRSFRDRRRRTLGLCLAAVFVLTAVGLWHGVAWRFVLFGLFQGVLLMVWRGLPFPREPRGPARIAHVLLFQAILLTSFVIFRSPSVDAMVDMARAMAGHAAGTRSIAMGGFIVLAGLAVFAIQGLDYFITDRPLAAQVRRLRRSNLAFCAVVIAFVTLFGYKTIQVDAVAPANTPSISSRFIYFDF